MRPEENPYQSPETVATPAPQPTALRRVFRYFAAVLAMPLGAGLAVVAVCQATDGLDAILKSLFGAAAMSMSYGQHWAAINIPLSAFLGANAGFAIVLRVFSETLIAGWIAIGAGGVALAAMLCVFLLFQDEVHLVDLLVYGPVTVGSIALLAAGAWWLWRQSRQTTR